MNQKDKYRIRNWREYNQSLINRGSITFWFNDEAIAKWYSTEESKKQGRPMLYSDNAIRCGLMVKAVFRIPFRALMGLLASFIKILQLELTCPHYSVFCRRAKHLKIPIRKLLKPGEKLNVIFDSTGVKVFGEGEWKVRQHGYTKRRTWRKVHIAMCADTGQIIIGAISSNDVSDDMALVQMMRELEGYSIGKVFGDMAYDTTDCRSNIYDLDGTQIIPPKKNARLQRKEPLIELVERDRAIRRIKELGEKGRALWKQEMGYHKRSRIETCMYRYKTILGDRLSSRRPETQTTEVMIKLDVLNRMMELGMPECYKMAS